MYMYVYIYICIYICSQTYIHTYIHTYIRYNWDMREYTVMGPANLTHSQIAGQSIRCLGVSDRVKDLCSRPCCKGDTITITTSLVSTIFILFF